MITITLTYDEARHTHECLRLVKDQETSQGKIWKEHHMNANVRTSIEREMS